MRSRIVFAGLVAAFAGACQPQAPTNEPAPAPAEDAVTPGVPTALTAAQIEAAQRGVRERLRNPDAARFGAMFGARTAEGVTMVCGFVDVVDEPEHFTGPIPFFGVVGSKNPARLGFAAIVSLPDNTMRRIIPSLCAERGIVLP